MKKNILILFLISLLMYTNSIAQTWPCVPDSNLTFNGISPATLPNAMAGYEYWSTLSFKIPKDSSISGINVTVDSAKFLYASGKPPGFTFACNAPNCVWPGGTKGCALFNGKVDSNFTDSTAEFPMKIYTLTWYRFTGGADQFSRIDSATNYVFRILKYTGLAEIKTYTHLTAYPNPTQGKITIDLRDIQNETNDVTVMDAFGKLVYHKTFEKPETFLTSLTVDLSNNAPGLYFITLKSGATVGFSKVQLR